MQQTSSPLRTLPKLVISVISDWNAFFERGLIISLSFLRASQSASDVEQCHGFSRPPPKHPPQIGRVQPGGRQRWSRRRNLGHHPLQRQLRQRTRRRLPHIADIKGNDGWIQSATFDACHQRFLWSIQFVLQSSLAAELGSVGPRGMYFSIYMQQTKSPLGGKYYTCHQKIFLRKPLSFELAYKFVRRSCVFLRKQNWRFSVDQASEKASEPNFLRKGNQREPIETKAPVLDKQSHTKTFRSRDDSFRRNSWRRGRLGFIFFDISSL